MSDIIAKVQVVFFVAQKTRKWLSELLTPCQHYYGTVQCVQHSFYKHTFHSSCFVYFDNVSEYATTSFGYCTFHSGCFIILPRGTVSFYMCDIQPGAVFVQKDMLDFLRIRPLTSHIGRLPLAKFTSIEWRIDNLDLTNIDYVPCGYVAMQFISPITNNESMQLLIKWMCANPEFVVEVFNCEGIEIPEEFIRLYHMNAKHRMLVCQLLALLTRCICPIRRLPIELFRVIHTFLL